VEDGEWHAPFPPKIFDGSRPLKRWRYVGIFCEELMACAALVQIGPARQSFWALHMREGGLMRERTRRLPRRGEVELIHAQRGTRAYAHARAGAPRREHSPGKLRLNDRGVLLDLTLEEDGGFEATCPNGASQVWTRKQAGITARGTLSLDGHTPRRVQALAVIDDTAGYHERITEWRWSAGVGESPDGVALAWNLVTGVNDPASGSERAVWIGGAPQEAPPVSFATDLSSINCEDGSQLRFTAEAQRARRENLLIVRSNYRAPFGTFAGTLPGGIELAHGLGVIEHHRARW
jgi:hypothetical protein